MDSVDTFGGEVEISMDERGFSVHRSSWFRDPEGKNPPSDMSTWHRWTWPEVDRLFFRHEVSRGWFLCAHAAPGVNPKDPAVARDKPLYQDWYSDPWCGWEVCPRSTFALQWRRLTRAFLHHSGGAVAFDVQGLSRTWQYLLKG